MSLLPAGPSLTVPTKVASPDPVPFSCITCFNSAYHYLSVSEMTIFVHLLTWIFSLSSSQELQEGGEISSLLFLAGFSGIYSRAGT